MAKGSKSKSSRARPPTSNEPASSAGSTTEAPGPAFAQPQPLPQQGHFRYPHISDKKSYAILDKLKKEGLLKPAPFPPARGDDPEPVLTLQQIWGDGSAARAQAISNAGQIIFHAAGDTGNTRSVHPQENVADKMESDFNEINTEERPAFFYHLGDVVYSFGEEQYYYDQFFEPYRNYPAPIVAIPGNHDGMVAPGSTATSLAAFVANFCAASFSHTSGAGGLDRTTMIQPGVYFTLEAPFARIIGLYSNVLEDPGVISSQAGHWPGIPDLQLDFLRAALTRIKKDSFKGAVIIATHHPPFTAGKRHGGSPIMLQEIDKICSDTGVWPHAFLSGHAHLYQRFTRTLGKMEIPYIVAGNGGHGLSNVRKKDNNAVRVPTELPQLKGKVGDLESSVVLENYDGTDYGYLRVIVNQEQLRIEYHPASDGDAAKTPDDHVTVDLASRTIGHYRPLSSTPGV
jgi:hypothetical protein